MMMFEYKSLLSRFKHAGSPKTLADPVGRTLTLPSPLGRERRTHAKQLSPDVAISLGEERAGKSAN
jgi:hypothetical protein